MKESNVETYLKKECEKVGGWCIKFLSLHINGLPDRICLFPGGVIIFIELKAPGKNPRKLQLRIHEKLRRLGFRVETIDNKDKVLKLLRSL